MAKQSAGLLIHRRPVSPQASGSNHDHSLAGEIEVLLVHPGGPFFKHKDQGAWSIPKGEIGAGEDPLAAARRELTEETGLVASGPFIELGSVTQRGGKVVIAYACAGDHDLSAIESNHVELEWPPRSGKLVSFPEVDRVEYFGLPIARRKVNQAQCAFLDRLERALSV